MKKHWLVVLTVLALALITQSGLGQTLPPSITLTGTIRDFTPSHPDFESYCCGQVNGLVKSALGTDGKPVFNAIGSPQMLTDATRFHQWYHDTPGVNQTGTISITLNRVGTTNTYTYSNNSFFPIDGQFFGNYALGHNFHFTTEFHTQFTYQGGETFNFNGDDDVWVFINKKLAIDIGGIHGAVSKSVNLNDIASSFGLALGGSYSLDIFQAERRTSGSNFAMTTSIFLTPAAPTQTTVASSMNPSTVGQAVTFTATVTSNGNPVTQGTVIFREGTTTLAGPFNVNMSGQASFSTSTLSPGSHTIIADYADGSVFTPSSGSIIQNVLACPAGLMISGTVPNFCQEDSQPVNLTLNGTNIGGATFSWSLIGPSPNPNLGTSQTLNTTLGGLAPGNYTIEGKVSKANCGSSVSVVNFMVFPSPTVIINGPTEVYQNESATLTANVTTGFPPYNFSWNTGATSSSISANTSILGTSSYTVNVKDGHGCDAKATASLLVKPRPVPPFSFSVTPGHICLPPFMVQNPSTTHYWWAKAAGSGDLEIEFSAVAVNALETGTATVRVYSPSNTLVASHTVPHPASGETPAPLIVIAGPAAGSIYRIEVNVAVPPPSVQGARHYRLELDGAEQLGTNSPLQAQAENESIRWGVNVLSGEPLNVNVQGGPEAPATAGSFEIRNPSGGLVTTSSLGSPVSISSTVPGMWTVTVTGLDHHVIVTKTTGADQGLYLGAFSDVVSPQIFVPGPISVLTGPGTTTCSVVVGDAQLGNATAKDNCEVHITRTGVPAGNLFPVGITTITYTATDGAGNTASASQTVTVVDNTPPTIAAPANVVVSTGAGATTCGVTVSDAQLGSATASDNCTVTVSRLGVPSGNMFPVGTTTVTYKATDGSGNSVSATQTVTVIDNTPPTIAACPQNIAVVVSYDQTGAAVSWPEPTASDNCSATLTSNYASGATFPPGTTTVTYTATDPAGQTATCSFTVTVNRSPNCTAAPSIAELWPPNHKMVNITIQGVSDPDGDPVTITITKITQDEPLNTLGDGNTEPDGAGVGTSIAQVRAERSGTPRVPGNGRVYRITYSASDGRGGECTGSVAVCVPHDQGNRSICIDDGQKYNSVTGEIEAPLATNGTMELGGNGNERRPAFLPTEYALADAYPNPFNPSTTIQYDVPELTHVRLTVYDMLGREVMVLVDGDREAGRYSVTMNADGLRSGVYVVRFHTDKFTQTRKIVLMK